MIVRMAIEVSVILFVIVPVWLRWELKRHHEAQRRHERHLYAQLRRGLAMMRESERVDEWIP